MSKNIITRFEKRYREALRIHLAEAPPRREGPGLKIGEDAASLGLDRLDLALVHGRAVAALSAPPVPGGGAGDTALPAVAGAFLDAALASVVRGNGAGREASVNPGKPTRGKASLTATRRELLREISLRLDAEEKLAKSARHYGELLAQSKRMQIQAKRLAQRVLLAQEAERKKISRDLHDEVAQTLAGINMQLEALKEASEVGGAELRKRIARTQLLVARSVRLVHRYARELRPALLDDLGLIPALRSYIRDLPGGRALTVRFKAHPGVEDLDKNRCTVIYRFVQEALTNICRHARAQSATVDIVTEGDAVRVEVHDDGKSFSVPDFPSPDSSGRLGLIGMRERVEMVGGVFTIESSPGKGTRVRAVIPRRGKLKIQKK